jgi:hypothetical protein
MNVLAHNGPPASTGLLLLAAAVLLAGTARAQTSSVPILPDGGGFGMDTPAGSGRHLPNPKTTVYKFTNLNGSGPGSLNEAVSAQGPRVVVFEVSGYIDEPIHINNAYITIAGQTAPWPGIVLRGAGSTLEEARRNACGGGRA